MSDTIKILSAGAPKAGLRQSAEAFTSAFGGSFAVEFATAPVIRERVTSGVAAVDVIVAPRPDIEAFGEAGFADPDTAQVLGAVAAGVVARNGSHEPEIGSVDELVASMRSAERIVYNTASSGRYISQMIAGLGLEQEIEPKIVRLPNGAAVMEYIATASPRTFGFGQITEIKLQEDLGIHVVGPLPGPLAHRTTYAATVASNTQMPDRAVALVEFMGSGEGRKIFSASGVT